MVSWLCLIGCLYIVAATLMVLVEDGQHRISSVLPSPIVLVLIGGVMYAVSQWMSQLIRGPVLAFLLSPIVAVAAVGWFVFCFAQTTSPLWWVALVGLTVPMFATWYLMRRFMEGRERPPQLCDCVHRRRTDGGPAIDPRVSSDPKCRNDAIGHAFSIASGGIASPAVVPEGDQAKAIGPSFHAPVVSRL